MIDQEVLKIIAADLDKFCDKQGIYCDTCPFAVLNSVDDGHWFCHVEGYNNTVDLPVEVLVDSYNMLLEESPDDCQIKEWNVEKLVQPDGTQHITKITGRVDDDINHPAHYTAGDIECVDAMKAAFGSDELKVYCKIAAFKYLWRADHKGGLQDIQKANWYLNKYLELERLENE